MSWATKLPKPAFFGIPLDPDKDGHMLLVQPLEIEHHRHATRLFAITGCLKSMVFFM